MKNLSIAKKIGLLNRVAQAAMAEGDNVSIIKIFTNEAVKVFGGDFAFAWGKFTVHDKYSLTYKTEGMPFTPNFPWYKSETLFIKRDEMPIFDNNVNSRSYRSSISKYLKSYIIVPIKYFDHIYGNIVVCHKAQHNFSEEEVALARSMGNIIAQAITINWLVESERKALSLSEKQESHFRALVENSYEIILQIDEDGKILYVSPSIKKFFGLNTSDVVGRNIVNFSENTGRKKIMSYIKKVIKNPNKRHVEEFKHKTKLGDVLFFESISSKMPSVGEKGSIVINMRDITEHKKLELARKMERELEEERIKVESIADTTHELRTPLAIIKGNIDLAVREGEAKKPMKGVLKDIDTEVKHLTNIVSDLATITSKTGVSKNSIVREKIDLSLLINEVISRSKSLAYTKNISITFNKTKNIFIWGDRRYLSKMLLNIIKNSVAYGRKNGHTKINLKTSKGFAIIDISDNGVGISKEDLPRIFERFYRGDKSHTSLGTGLGLAMVKWVAEVHGGKVIAKSTKDKGSVFSVYLPVRGREAI